MMVNDLMARAQRQSAAEKVRQYPRVSRDAARLAAAVGVLFEASVDEEVTLAEIWGAIDDVVPRSELRAALDSIASLTPAPQADPGGEWRGLLLERYTVVRKFVPLLVGTIEFGATARSHALANPDAPAFTKTHNSRRARGAAAPLLLPDQAQQRRRRRSSSPAGERLFADATPLSFDRRSTRTVDSGRMRPMLRAAGARRAGPDAGLSFDRRPTPAAAGASCGCLCTTASRCSLRFGGSSSDSPGHSSPARVAVPVGELLLP